MEKRTVVKKKYRGLGLNALFWRYFITTGFFIIILCLAWLFLFNILVNMGFVMSAYTAVRGLLETEQMLQEQEVFNAEEIPHFYEWALVEDGNIIESNMNSKQMEYARRELAGDSAPYGRFYSQYFYPVLLENGQKVMLEYDYSVCYADPKLQAILPDFQVVYIGFLLVLLLVLTAMRTGHYTKILRKDTQAITDACEMVSNQKLDVSLHGQATVKELQAALTAIDTLRRELSHSLKEQWSAEQRKKETLAALAHDLKTPLTVIGGNAQLLEEDDLTQQQKKLVQTILRNTAHAEEYVSRLREVTAGDFFASNKEEISICELFEACIEQGHDLLAVKGQELLIMQPVSVFLEEKVEGEKRELMRAVENIFSNAARFTPVGGTVTLGMEMQHEQVGIWIQDSGPGFSKESLAKAGRTFYTEDSSRPQSGHMGMGLFFASQVAQKHGGSLYIENTPGGGRVYLWLALHKK